MEIADFDVVIVGGGVSGLYMAWRLANSTKLKVLILEKSERFGGRYQTIEMPGGFAADLAAMRYIPHTHRILDNFVKEMGLTTKPMVCVEEQSRNKLKQVYYRGKRASSAAEVCQIYNIKQEELPFLAPSFPFLGFPPTPSSEIILRSDGNLAGAVVRRTGQLAKDTSVSQFLTLSHNAELLTYSQNKIPAPFWSLSDSLAMTKKVNTGLHLVSAHMVVGGFGQLIDNVVATLGKQAGVAMEKNQQVIEITEGDAFFTLKSKADGDQNNGGSQYKAKHVVYACGIPGMQSIALRGSVSRQEKIEALLRNVAHPYEAFKLFLTYRRAWWEDYGLVQGQFQTDLPIRAVISFGEMGKSKDYATILILSFRQNEVFQGLNSAANERFINECGSIAEDLMPSELLVDYVEKQMKTFLGCDIKTERPVCTAAKFWGSSADSPGALFHNKIGVDSNKLNWESLKPFDDANLYITGDTFTAWDETGSYAGFSETALLTSERILVKHFGLTPVIDNLSLQDPWPQGL